MKKAVLAIALALAVPLGAAACGGDDEKEDEDQVRDVIALVNDRSTEACDKLTATYMKRVLRGDRADCEKRLKNMRRNAVKIQKVEIDGDKATVTGDIQGENGEIFLVKDGDDWKLDDVQR